MTLHQFFQKYSLYGSIITNWNWADSRKLVLEMDLSNLNQSDYQESDSDFREVLVLFNQCILEDNLDEGFTGFDQGDARIISVEYSARVGTGSGMDRLELVFMHDRYDGSEEKLVSVNLHSSDVTVVDPAQASSADRETG
mgnify:CR=1 FL=1